MMQNHGSARSRWNHDILGPLEDLQKVPRDACGLLTISAIEGRLSTTSLVGSKLDVAPGTFEHFRHRHADARKNLVDDAGDEERDASQELVYFDESFKEFTAVPAILTRSPRSWRDSSSVQIAIAFNDQSGAL